MNRMIRGWILLCAFVSASAGAAERIEVVDPYVRATPPGMTISAAFFGLSNSGAADVSLVAISCEVAATAELHEHSNTDGLMQMRQVEAVPIPANGKAELRPGGFHVMLFGLKQALKPGDKVTMELRFSNGEKRNITADVRKINPDM